MSGNIFKKIPVLSKAGAKILKVRLACQVAVDDDLANVLVRILEKCVRQDPYAYCCQFVLLINRL